MDLLFLKDLGHEALRPHAKSSITIANKFYNLVKINREMETKK